MHRSGTSALARGLEVLGVPLGSELLPARADNPKGFWEDREVFRINEAVLKAAGRRWDSVAPPGDSSWALPEVTKLQREATDLIRSRLASRPIWGFKEPRTCRLLPFWQAVFREAGVQDGYVIILRNPVSVASSLADRNDFTPEKSYLLWLGHLIPALRDTEGRPRMLLDYDLLMADPGTELARIRNALDLSEPAEGMTAHLEAYAADFLDASLRHAHWQDADLVADARAWELVTHGYALMERAARGNTDSNGSAFLAEFRDIEARWRALTPIYAYLDDLDDQARRAAFLSQEVAEKDNNIAGLEAHTAGLEVHAAGLERALAEKDNNIAALEAHTAGLEVHAAGLERALAEKDNNIAALDRVVAEKDRHIAGLKRAIEERDQHVLAMLQSTSWRVTAQFRFVGRQWLKARHVAQLFPELVDLGGGLLPAIRRAFRVMRREGPEGIRLRIRYLVQRQAAQAHLALTAADSGETERYRHRLRPRRVNPHAEQVDIIVCVHNALDDVRACLGSVTAHTPPPYRLIVVDDGSDAPTRDYLCSFMKGQPGELLRNEQARGYTRAANRGLRAGRGDFAVLLNSDTLVTRHWLDRMVECARADGRIGVVGPLSNTASWQSVPDTLLDETGDWHDNPLPAGWTPDDYARCLAETSPRAYPRVGFVNGFCYFVRRRTLDDVGLFDEDTFGRGYGEENDFCLRAIEKGWLLAIADDAYVYHAQSRSYSHERRAQLVKRSNEALVAKHGGTAIMSALDRTRHHPQLLAMRARARLLADRAATLSAVRERYEGRRVLFLLPAGHAGGGGNIVIREARALRAMGVDAQLANLTLHRPLFEQHHPHLDMPILYLDDPARLADIAGEYDAVVATLYITAHWLSGLPTAASANRPVLGYYIQDYEPNFFPPDSPDHKLALESYTLSGNIRLFTKTDWNRRMLKDHVGVEAQDIGPSYDWDLFYPGAGLFPDVPVRVTAMVRPSTPRRSPEMTLRILRRLKQHFGERVRITVFGVAADDPDFLSMAHDFEFECTGLLPSPGMADLLGTSHVFLDFSAYQAMGLTALEAMACGVAVVGPEAGGLGKIVQHEVDGLLVDTTNEDACFEAAARLVEDTGLRKRLAEAGIVHAPRYYPERAAAQMLDALFQHADI